MGTVIISILLLLIFLGIVFIGYSLINIAQIIQESEAKILKKIKESHDYNKESVEKENKLWENLGKTLIKIIESN